MRKLIFIPVFVFLSIFLIHTPVSGHGSGPPYVKINGQYANTNPITNYIVPTAFTIGADLASPSGFLVSTPITFEIDEQYFPNPYKYVPGPLGTNVPNTETVTPQFQWDYGDGSQLEEGKKLTHSYQKPGTFIVNILVKFPGKTEDYSSVNSVQLNIVPTKDYQLPVAKIFFNGDEILNPARDIKEIKPGSKVTFDGSPSTGTIVKYEWDFGDGGKSEDKSAEHSYNRDEYYPVFPILRVTDDHGLTNESFVFVDTPIEKHSFFQKFIDSIRDFFSGILGR